MNPQIIAYYLPQFHPIKENDEWWGKGFTEWTNVGKAKPLFKGHNQPRVPTELGYYDLRLPEVREQQAQLAREAGITAFCYWHYWFGNGKQLLNEIIDDVLRSGKPDFPFCLGWANESWKAKQWNKDGKGDKVLIEQCYGGFNDYRKHYEYVSTLFKDKRYFRVNNNPFFLIYQPSQFQEIKEFIFLWNKWIKEDGISEKIYFVANLDDERETDYWINIGFDAITPANLQRADYKFYHFPSLLRKIIGKFRTLSPYPTRIDYKEVNNHIWNNELDYREDVIPFLIPNWDHTPRSGKKGRVFVHSTPLLFEEQARKVIGNVHSKQNQLIILKSWNEWAEGNYMEPDLMYGKAYINALKNAIKNR